MFKGWHKISNGDLPIIGNYILTVEGCIGSKAMFDVFKVTEHTLDCATGKEYEARYSTFDYWGLFTPNKDESWEYLSQGSIPDLETVIVVHNPNDSDLYHLLTVTRYIQSCFYGEENDSRFSALNQWLYVPQAPHGLNISPRTHHSTLVS